MSYHGHGGGPPPNIPPPYGHGYIPGPGGFPGSTGFPPPVPMNVPPPMPPAPYGAPYVPSPMAPPVPDYSLYENRQDSRSTVDYASSRGKYGDPFSSSTSSDRKYSPAPDTSSQRSRDHNRSSYHDTHESRRSRGATSSHERDEYKPSSKKSNISLDELLQDERLKNVLFAGLSKATAKLEQSLATTRGDTPENVAFIDDSAKGSTSQLFPAAASSSDPQQKAPKSILKRKTTSSAVADDENSNDSFSKLSALEKTLQLLRGKSSSSVSSHSDRTKSDSDKPPAVRGALGQLASYNDAADEDTYLYSNKEKSPSASKSKSTSRSDLPFWSVNAASHDAETVKRETDTFDIQEKLYEQWRQSINKTTDDSVAQRAEPAMPQVDPFFQKKIPSYRASATSEREGEPKDSEELDSTVQNILQSIGFNFDLSKRMQELARQKKKKQDEMQTAVIDQSASFLSQGSEIADDLRASLFKDEKEKASIENLIREARASAQKSRASHDRSMSPGKWSDRTPRETSTGRRNRSPPGRESRSPDRFRDMGRSSLDTLDSRKRRSPERAHHQTDWETASPGRSDEEETRRQDDFEDRVKHQSYLRENEVATPPQGRYKPVSEENRISSRGLSDRDTMSHPARISERLKDEPKDEYYYPEDNDYLETAPAMPLLTSFSSRRREESLASAGSFPSGKGTSQAVENFRVMSRTVQDDDDSFTESRRIILPAKSDRRVIHRSPPYTGSRSPETRYLRKRSPSPLSPRMSKERRLYSERDDFQGGRGGGYYPAELPDREKADSMNYQMKITTFRGRTPDRRETPSPHYSPDRQSWTRYKSPLSGRSSERERNLSPRYPQADPGQVFDRLDSSPFRKKDGRFSPDSRRSPVRDDYYEKESRRRSSEHRFSRSPGRRRSRSPDRRRSRSPYGRKYRSRSPDYRRRSPERRRSPNRRYSPGRNRRRSPGRHRSPERRRSDARRGSDKGVKASEKKKADTNKFKIDRRDKPPEQPKVDMKRMKPEERKAYLTKLLEEKGQTVDEAKQNLLSALATLTSVSPEQRKVLIMKMAEVTPEERQRMMQHLSLRQVKVTALKTELEKMKKEQNELMRKCQRSGLGMHDPSLKKNAEDQKALEDEIQRLSAADLFVPLEVDVPVSPPLSHLAPDSTKDVKKTPASTTDKKAVSGKVESPAGVKEQKLASQEPIKEKSGEVTKTTPATGSEKWKSVTVGKDNKLPEIGEPVKKETSTNKDKLKAEDGKKKNSKEKETKQEKQPQYPSGKQKVYYEYYDSGNHWCKYCGTTCNSLDQLFQHCHGKKHLTNIELEKRPWKENKKDQKQTSQKVGIAQSRRIKGVEMMFPVVGFYCSLCKIYCGDFSESTDHLKSDSHYDKYMDFVQHNSMYEKKLLLEKTTSLSVKKHTEKSSKPPPPPEPPKQPPPPPPPPPPPSTASPPTPKEKKGKSVKASKDSANKVKTKKQLRVTGKNQNQDSDEEELKGDIIDVVDMELEDEEEAESERDVKSKVPKLIAKPASVLPPWTALANEGSSSGVDMKESKEDDNKPLDQFLTIKTETAEQQTTKLPVLGEISVSDIPVPQGPRKKEDSDLPPLPAGPVPPAEPAASVSTVKSLNETLADEKKEIDEEKRMMGIDVDAQEEQPLDAIPVPPPPVTSAASDESEKTDSKKSKPSLDSLFAKLSRSVAHRTKPKTPTVSQKPSVSEIEQQIQEEIQAKLAREKMKILRKKQKEEQKKLDEEKPHKKTLNESSSSEESDDSDEDDGNEDESAQLVTKSEDQVTEQREEMETTEPETELFTLQPAQELQDSTDAVSATQKVDNEVAQPELVEADTQEITASDQSSATDLEEQMILQNAGAKDVQQELIQTNTQVSTTPDAELTTGPKTQQISETEATGAQSLTQIEQVRTEEEAPGVKKSPIAKPDGKGKAVKEAIKPKRGKKRGQATDVSDLGAFFAAVEKSDVTTKSISTKKGVKRGGLKKSGRAKALVGKRSATSSVPDQDEELDEEALSAMMFGEGMIVLSEVNDEEDEGSRNSVTEADLQTKAELAGANITNQSSGTVDEVMEQEPGMSKMGGEGAPAVGAVESVAVSDQHALAFDPTAVDTSQDLFKLTPSRGRGRGRGKRAGAGRGRRKKGRDAPSTDVSVSEETVPESEQMEQPDVAVTDNQDDSQTTEELAESDQAQTVADQMEEEESPPLRQTRSTRSCTPKTAPKRQTRSRTRQIEGESAQDTRYSEPSMEQSDMLPSQTEMTVTEDTDIKSNNNTESEWTLHSVATNLNQPIEPQLTALSGDVPDVKCLEESTTLTQYPSETYEPRPEMTEKITDTPDTTAQPYDSDSDATITEETEDPFSPLPQTSEAIDVADECQPVEEVTTDSPPRILPDMDSEIVEQQDYFPTESQQPLSSAQAFTDERLNQYAEDRFDNVSSNDQSGPEMIATSPVDATDNGQEEAETVEEIDETDGSKFLTEPTSRLQDEDGTTSIEAQLSFEVLPSEEQRTDTPEAEDILQSVQNTPGGQGKDPPMSGVVSDMEESDSIMVSVDQAQESALESEISPTAGLTFGLDEDEDSMEFAMAELQEKIEHVSE